MIATASCIASCVAGRQSAWKRHSREIMSVFLALGVASVERFRLFRYLDEQTFRYNDRRDPHGEAGRFRLVVRGSAGKRITYKGLTGKTDQQEGS